MPRTSWDSRSRGDIVFVSLTCYSNTLKKYTQKLDEIELLDNRIKVTRKVKDLDIISSSHAELEDAVTLSTSQAGDPGSNPGGCLTRVTQCMNERGRNYQL